MPSLLVPRSSVVQANVCRAAGLGSTETAITVGTGGTRLVVGTIR